MTMIVNQIKQVYNDFSQLTESIQSHSGAVTGSTPKVQMTYASGSGNTIRQTGLIYPNGRELTYDYSSTDSMADAISRISSIIDDDDTHLVVYDYLGLGTFVIADDTEPDIKWTLVDLSSTNDPDTGDIYSGLDRFGRTKDCRWYDYGNTTDVVRLKYGYDRASNRLWREDLVAQSYSKHFDELYNYDGLHRLNSMQRGLLNGGKTAITNQTYGQCWNLDATENWTGMKQADTGTTWTLEQSRTANTVNEITDITNSVGSAWVDPAYDPAGNMTTIPKPTDPTESFTATWDAWNRMVKLVDDDTSNTIAEYQYDAQARRIVRKTYTGGTLDETRHDYLTPNWQTIEERVDSSTVPHQQYVWGLRYIDDCLRRDRDTSGDGTLDECLYAVHDAAWNVTALSDNSAVVEERFAYQPFGTSVTLDDQFSIVADGFSWQWRFTSRLLDQTTLLYFFRHRYFSSQIGIFVTRDSLRYVDGASLYIAYFIPASVDPTGNMQVQRSLDCQESASKPTRQKMLIPESLEISHFYYYPYRF